MRMVCEHKWMCSERADAKGIEFAFNVGGESFSGVVLAAGVELLWDLYGGLCLDMPQRQSA